MVYISLVYITLKNVDPVYIIVLQKHTLGGFTPGSENIHYEGGSEGFFSLLQGVQYLCNEEKGRSHWFDDPSYG